jgi:hypothetical protein
VDRILLETRRVGPLARPEAVAWEAARLAAARFDLDQGAGGGVG